MRNLFIGLTLTVIGGGAGWFYWGLTQPGVAPPPISVSFPAPPETIRTGLDALPTESGLIVGLDLAAVRKRPWFLQLLDEGDQKTDADYQDFVASTGFEYTRDLTRLWLGVFGSTKEPSFAGVAEGDFSREKILAHAKRYGATSTNYRGTTIIEVNEPLRIQNSAINDQMSSFALAFLQDGRMAFGSDSERVQMVIDVIAGKRPSIGRNRDRAARIYASVGDAPMWVVNDLNRWMPPQLAKYADVTSLIREFAGSMEIHRSATRLHGSILCNNAEQASKLKTNLKLLLLTGGFLLKRSDQLAMRTFAGHMGKIETSVVGSRVRIVLELTPAELIELLDQAESLELP